MPAPLMTNLDDERGVLTLAAGHNDADRGVRIGYTDERYPRIKILLDGTIYTGDGTAEPTTPFTSGVTSVNGHTGAVSLTYTDVGADAAGAAAAAQAASQPADSDLTAIAALATTTFGRSLLTQADAAATRTTLGLGSAATQATTAFDAAGAAAAAQSASQPLDSDLTAIAALVTTSYGRAFLTQADAAAARTYLGVSTGPARSTVVYTTASLASNAAETGTVTLGKSYRILNVSTDRACRVQLYTTAAKRTADASRAAGTDPTGDHGVMLDVVTTGSLLALDTSPQADGSNVEASPSTAISLRVTNLSGATSTVAVTFTYITTEV